MDEKKMEEPKKPQHEENTPSPSPTLTTSDGGELEPSDTVRTVGILKLRGKTDDLPRSWWFASTAVPLIAATQGPFSNVLSVCGNSMEATTRYALTICQIAALATVWRIELPNGGQLTDSLEQNGRSWPSTGCRWPAALQATFYYYFTSLAEFVISLHCLFLLYYGFWLLESS
ncbi:hypothetical protein GGR57DRAFT_337986 [Xylariaceae sp. FL1272]|nr:hypothetical protein GGR57DRAFT_337986 [Xylariaceae sp. FL1272]